MPSSSLKDGLISKQDANFLGNINEIVEVGEYDEINENDNKNDDPSTVSLKSVKVEENNDQETTKQNDDQKMPNETAQYLNDKIRKKRGVHLALIRVSNVFLLVVLPFFMVQCKLT